MMIYWTISYGITDGQNGVLTNGTDENYIPFGIFRMPHTSYAGGIIIEFLTVRMTIFT